MKILVTGFDPFAQDTINPSWEVVKRLAKTIDSAQIVPLMLPTSAYTSLERIKEALRLHQPDVILSIGQAKGRTAISVERIGININDFRIPDNNGKQYVQMPIFDDGPDAYFSDLPIYAMVKEIRKAGLPAEISNTAGTFVCNHVLYGVRYILAHTYPAKRSGFIHIPCLKEQATGTMPYMELSDMIKGITAAIRAIACEDGEMVSTQEGTLD